MWVLFAAPTPTSDGQTAEDLYRKRLTWITDAMREDARALGCRFHRAWYAEDGSAFYALANWESREGGSSVLRAVGHPGRAGRGRDHAPRGRGAGAGTLGRRSPTRVAPSNAKASCSTHRSSPGRPTICRPTGSPASVKPHGTEIAGAPRTVIVQHDAIQSRYVVIGTPATTGGYSSSASNGATCATGCTRTSTPWKNDCARPRSSRIRSTARSTSASVRASPCSIFHTTVALIRSRCTGRSSPSSAA